MSNIVDQLTNAQKYGLSIRPNIGGFPVLAEALRQAGVQMNFWSLPSCQSVYVMKEGSVVQQGTPLIMGTHAIPKFDQFALIKAIRADQEGHSTFPELLKATWEAGVISYEADFINRKVTYFGATREKYTEEYPAAKI